MNTIIAYKEKDHVAFVSTGKCYYGEIILDTSIKGVYNLDNGLTIATSIVPGFEVFIDIINDALGEEDVELNEDYLKDVFIPTAFDISNNMNLLDIDSDTKVATLPEKIIVAKGSEMYLINYDLDTFYVPSMVAIGNGENDINLLLATNIYNDLDLKERMKKIILLHYKYQKHDMDKFIYMNTLGEEECF